MTEFIKRNALLNFLASSPLTITLLLIFAVSVAVATFLEVRFGTEGARALVYNAKWFEGLLALLVLNLIVSLIASIPFPLARIGFFLTHLSFIVVLVASGITRWFGYEGVMSIREGASSNYMYSSRDYLLAFADDEKVSFPIRLWKEGKNNIRRHAQLGDTRYDLAITEYWPNYDEEWREGPGGDPTVMLAYSEGRTTNREIVKAGENLTIGGVRIQFLDRPFDDEIGGGSTSKFGDIVIGMNGETHRIAIVPGDRGTAGGYEIEFTEFHPSFKVGADPDLSAPMENPAVRLKITDPSGESDERLLFAFHPDFASAHGKKQGFEDLEIRYDYARNLYLVMDDTGNLEGRADFDFSIRSTLSEHGTQPEMSEPAKVPVGSSASIREQSVLDMGGTLVAPVEIWKSATLQPVASEDENRPSAVRISATDSDGNQAEAIARRGWGGSVLKLGDKEVEVGYGPVRIDVPYEIHLDDFALVTYPGSENPASFESHVRLIDASNGIDGKEVRIYMNHPLTYRGYKHFQSSYDTDRKGTILSVNHDPGKWPTYFGYTMMTIGFLLTLLRGTLFGGAGPRRAAGVVVAAIMAASTGPAAAQEDPHAGHNHPPGEHGHETTPALQKNFLSPETRAAVNRLMVQDFQGRMKPIDTLARESIMKVAKSASWEEWEPVDMYLSWMAEPRSWIDQLIVRVRYEGLRDMLGMTGDVKHIDLMSLYDGSGSYRLSADVENARRTPDNKKSKTQKKLISLDDRINLFHMTAGGYTFRVFPVPGDENNTWLTAEDAATEVEPALGEQYQWLHDRLLDGLARRDDSAVREAVEQISALQHEHGAAVMPSETAFWAELQLNRYQPFMWASIPYLIAFPLLIGAYGWSLARHRGGPLRLFNPIYLLGLLVFIVGIALHFYGYTLRWIASGRAPLSNGYESLIFIALIIGIAGFFFELGGRRGSIAGPASLLASVILGVAMLPTFDPAITPLVPVLSSAWLIIHVTIITASYGFLGLASLMSMIVLILHLFHNGKRQTIHMAIFDLDKMHWHVLLTGLAFLTVGTFLGGVWANESWGRYWGWDPKESWALVTILFYAAVVHFRFVPKLRAPIHIAAGSFLSVASIGMTYFGVNYFLSGLHSYAQGDAPGVPAWVYYMGAGMIVLTIAAYVANRKVPQRRSRPA